MLGYSDSLVIIVARTNDNYDDILNTGLIKDLRTQTDLNDTRIAYDYAHNVIYSRPERIRICNLIREKLSARKDYRWCGAEMEALINKKLLYNAREIISLAEMGHYVDSAGLLKGELPWAGTLDFSVEICNHCNFLKDKGQQKLCATFFAQIIRGAIIVYVGSSPGNGWIHALSLCDDDLNLKIISIDPRDLDAELEGLPNVTHINALVNLASDLLNVLPETQEAVLIWDARSDFSDANKEEIVKKDISILNSILVEQEIYKRFKYMHLKINTTDVKSYVLPRGGRFYPQPYTVERGIFATRYVVWHHTGEEDIDLITPTQQTFENLSLMLENIQTLISAEGAYACTQRLVANYLTSKFRSGDYLSSESNFKIKEVFSFYHKP